MGKKRQHAAITIFFTAVAVLAGFSAYNLLSRAVFDWLGGAGVQDFYIQNIIILAAALVILYFGRQRISRIFRR